MNENIMDQKYGIVVIEDQQKHLEEVKGLIEARSDIVSAVYAANLAAAIDTLNSRKYDGILSDAHFPEREGAPESPCGKQIIDYAMTNRLPFTIVTSTYHHGSKTEPISRASRSAGIELIDEEDVGDSESSSKRWSDGLATLVFLIDAQRAWQLTYEVKKSRLTGQESLQMIGPDGQQVKFSLEPYKEHALDEIRTRLRL